MSGQCFDFGECSMGAALCCCGMSGLRMAIRLLLRVYVPCPWWAGHRSPAQGPKCETSDPSKELAGHAVTTQTSEELNE